MPESPSPTSPNVSPRPSKTNPQCKVCASPDRFEIEVALARGQSQGYVATRFSRNGQTFSRQNIHTHYHKHMPVLDLAVAEAAAQRGISPVLDIDSPVEGTKSRLERFLRARGYADQADRVPTKCTRPKSTAFR